MAELIKESWERALEFWGSAPQLNFPVDIKQTKDRNDAIAYINMSSRQVVYNLEWLEKRQIKEALPAIFAHELGHHLRFPHSLVISAELHLLAQSLIPDLPFYYINLFWDLLVNETVGTDEELRAQLVKIYEGSIKGEKNISEVYSNYLTVYEFLWGIEGHFGLKVEEKWKLHLQKFTQEFYQLHSFHSQFIYFLSYFVRFLEDPMLTEMPDPFSGDAGIPEPGDYPAGGGITEAMKRALKNAREKGWIEKGEDDENENSYSNLQRALRSLPGSGEGHVRSAAHKHYLQLIEKFINELPSMFGEAAPDKFLPSITESWEVGDEVHDIDWQESLARSGENAAAGLLRREKIADDPEPLGDQDRPMMEIYLDTSGSMPSPLADTNMMTLAALILSSYAIRKGGKVKGIIYSDGNPIISDWMQAENFARDFFLNYIGGGTNFPFERLKKFSQQKDKIYRVIISDSDFLYNLRYDESFSDSLKTALERSYKVVFVLAGVETEELKTLLGPLYSHARCSPVYVKDFKDFARVSAKLAESLLGGMK